MFRIFVQDRSAQFFSKFRLRTGQLSPVFFLNFVAQQDSSANVVLSFSVQDRTGQPMFFSEFLFRIGQVSSVFS